MKNDLTIVIPSHNRHRYFERFLTYYSDFDCDILIVDSTITAFEFKSKSVNIFYEHLPEKTFTGKLSFAFNKIKTKFVVLCADDDFLIKDGLKDCIAFLNENTSYSVALGNNIYYKKETIKNYFFHQVYFNHSFEKIFE